MFFANVMLLKRSGRKFYLWSFQLSLMMWPLLIGGKLELPIRLIAFCLGLLLGYSG
ncbi:hypothetical protein LINPERPRIM_LOCUS27345 [Linum perenne]